MARVLHYSLGYNFKKKKGAVSLHIEGLEKPKTVSLAPDELAAVAAILRQAPVHVSSEGHLRTDWEPVHDEDKSFDGLLDDDPDET